MRFAFFISILFLGIKCFGQRYESTDNTISFFSFAPLENITATNNNVRAKLNTSTGKLDVSLSVEAFEFRKRLMKKHFNEQYLESAKYPIASFDGYVLGFALSTEDEIKEHRVKGKLTIHGVSKEIVIKADFSQKGNQITAMAKMMVACADYKIKIPKMFTCNIAETVEVNITLNLYQND